MGLFFGGYGVYQGKNGDCFLEFLGDGMVVVMIENGYGGVKVKYIISFGKIDYQFGIKIYVLRFQKVF